MRHESTSDGDLYTAERAHGQARNAGCLGFTLPLAIAGLLAPTLFVFAAMVDDYRSVQRIHPVYLQGVLAIFGLMAVTFVLVMNPAGEPALDGVAWLGRSLRPLY